MENALNLDDPTVTVFERMSELLDTKLETDLDAVAAVSKGISTRGYKRLLTKLGFAPSLVAPESTVRRRLAQNARFSESESERMVRLARVFAEAVELFNSERQATLWLNTPATFLGDGKFITPLELAATDAGARVVEAQLRRTAYGIF